MNEQNKKVPTVRFKGFTNDWEQHKFSEDMVSFHTGTNLTGKISNTGEKLLKMGNMNFGSFDFEKIERLPKSVKIDKTDYVKYGDFLFNTRNTLELVGKGATWMSKNDSFVFNNNIARLNLKNINTFFFNYYYNSQYMGPKIHSLAVGTTSVAAIYPRDLKQVNYYLPLIPEQNQLSKLFVKLDELITLQQRKLALLKQLKKGMLQKMFAEKNSKQPALRFKGFHDDWEQRKLGELYSYHNGKAHEQNQRSSGKYELINLNSISVDGTLKSSGRYINHADEILRQNDLVMILSDIAHGTLLGRVAIIPQDNKYVLNQRVALLRPISKSENSNFMAPLINNNQRYFHKMGIGTSQLNISKSTVIESLWQIPKIKEQSVIGNFLQNIDHIIALQHQKLAKYQSVKKSLLQQMFI